MIAFAIPEGRFQTKQDLAYHALHRAIVRGELPPGERLVIEDVAARLEVSPIPVREALQRLERERLIEIRPHAGAVVSALSRADVDEVFALIEALEAAAAAPACAHATPEELTALERTLAALERARASGDHERWLERNAGFHLALIRLARMPLLAEMAERVFDRWERLRRHFFAALAERDEHGDVEHARMLSLLRARDAAGLEALLREHARSARDAYRARGA